MSPTNKTVLVVDDERGVRQIVRSVLERQGFAVTAVAGGEEALAVIDRNVPDLVMLDLMMPGMDGLTLLKAIRQRWTDLPVVVLTGFAEGEAAREILEYGPMTLLNKPFVPQELTDTVASVLERGANTP